MIQPSNPYLSLNPEVAQVFRDAKTVYDEGDITDNPVMVVFRQVTKEATLHKILERFGYDDKEIDMTIKQVKEPTIFKSENLLWSNLMILHRADGIAREHQAVQIGIKDMELAFFTLQTPPLDKLFKKLKMPRYDVVARLQGSLG